ncbi:unnamed protein product [Victoria cruziana]
MASKAIPCLLVAMFLIQCAAACSSCKPPVAYKPSSGYCPVDAVKLGACVDLLHGLLHLVVGHPPSGSDCCPLIQGLADLDAAACLCTAVKADVLGIKVDLDVQLSLLANTCGCKIPKGYECH